MFKKTRPARPQALWRAERTRGVREYGKGARTPLADLFNIRLENSFDDFLNAALHIRVIGDGSGNGGVAGLGRGHALLD
jgi:hypothetical protein